MKKIEEWGSDWESKDVSRYLKLYQSNNLNNQMKKRQYWIREEGTWKIIFEGAA